MIKELLGKLLAPAPAPLDDQDARLALAHHQVRHAEEAAGDDGDREQPGHDERGALRVAAGEHEAEHEQPDEREGDVPEQGRSGARRLEDVGTGQWRVAAQDLHRAASSSGAAISSR